MLNFSNQIQIYTLYFQKSGDGDNDSIKTINISSRVKKIKSELSRSFLTCGFSAWLFLGAFERWLK
jgi:hypothetical protein